MYKTMKKFNPVAIGIFLVSGIILMLFFIYFAGKFSFILGGGYRFFIEYEFLDNLQSGAKVRVSGGPAIGYVRNISFESGKIVVEVLINGKYKLNRDANFSIYSTSLVGQKYINVSGYKPNSPNIITNNDYIIGITPMGFARTIEFAGAGLKTIFFSESEESLKKLQTIFNNISDLIQNLNYLVKDNSSEISLAIQRLNQVVKTSVEIANRLNNSVANIESGTKKLNSTIQNIDEAEVKNIISNMSVISTELKNLSVEINKLSYDKNSVLNVVRDKEFRTRLDNTMKNVEEFSKKVKDNPSILFFGK
ncbi:MAG: MlaD family protein [Brevinematia bacterium]